jgi:hypothetical protein
MLDSVNLNPPSVLKDIEEATRAIGFTMGSDLLTGSLLRTLAASKPSGIFLNLGTGTGLSAAWILDGMDAQSILMTKEELSILFLLICRLENFSTWMKHYDCSSLVVCMLSMICCF